ncbi:hypothetical protein QL919_01730 [Psychrobacter sp. APC 3426]|uniref:hypothetical protein n=1 Tax=Psychrobacter sp. APC 3426 TaxID=3035177 RepID=UPI0025B46C0F|nr:hypothetical protein [Psychrobacter sp. APC 3426]MDN3397447.1 hypothetical protein [Psychrobacter sp. APC 3426]
MLNFLERQKQETWVDTALSISIRFIVFGFILALGFVLIMASNVGPAYLPHIMDGALDFWTRMTLLSLGLLIWIITPVWTMWMVLRYLYHCIIRNH